MRIQQYELYPPTQNTESRQHVGLSNYNGIFYLKKFIIGITLLLHESTTDSQFIMHQLQLDTLVISGINCIPRVIGF